MNQPCAACGKIVYPMEQLKCLDQIWHKPCFRCASCNMVLNMKNYRGYEKKPYCNAHYPQPSKFTVVADTPENQRVAANTKIVSNVKYHEDFEKSKGAKISVTEDPLTKQQMQNSQIQSQVVYHGKLNQKNNMEIARRSSIENNGSHSIEVTSVSSPTGDRLSRSIGKISDYDPFDYEDPPNSGTRISNPGRQDQNSRSSSISGSSSLQRQSMEQNYPPSSRELRFRALYDYVAQDDDEVSFIEGDIICQGDPIDEGWMYGTVERSGHRGMLPSNYMEPL